MKMLDVPDLLIKALECCSEGDFQNAMRLILEAQLIICSTAERFSLSISVDRYLEVVLQTLTSMRFKVSKDELRKESIFDIQNLTRLSNPARVQVLKWMFWSINDYLFLTGKSCKEFTAFKRRYVESIKQKSI